MIPSNYITGILQTGFNNINTIPNTQFVVIPDVAKLKQPTRNGNTVTNYINCVLTRSPNANETTNGGLIIAVDEFDLTVIVPLESLKTTPGQNPVSWVDDIDEYVQSVKSVVDDYFLKNQTNVYTDNDISYTIGFTYTATSTGTVERSPEIGDYISFRADISALIVEGGLNSMSVTLSIDGKIVPFQSFTPNRNTISISNVWSDSNTAKIIQTASVLAIDVAAPASQSTSNAGEWLLNGNPMTAHFVGITYNNNGQTQTVYKLMQFDNSKWGVAGVMNVGENYALCECPYIPDLLNFEEPMNVAVYEFDTPSGGVINENIAETQIVMFPNKTISEVIPAATPEISYTLQDGETFYSNGKYYAYLIYCKKADNYG